jgi:hypothetical protein
MHHQNDHVWPRPGNGSTAFAASQHFWCSVAKSTAFAVQPVTGCPGYKQDHPTPDRHKSPENRHFDEPNRYNLDLWTADHGKFFVALQQQTVFNLLREMGLGLGKRACIQLQSGRSGLLRRAD